MSDHAKRYPRFGGSWCPDCHEFGGIHATGCPNDETDNEQDAPVERDTETLEMFDTVDFMEKQQ